VLLVLRDLLQQPGWDVGDQLRLAGAEHMAHAAVGGGILRIPLRQLHRQLPLLRVGVGDGEAADVAVGAEHVDGAPVRDLPHRQLPHLFQGGLVVEGGGEHLARLGEEALPPRGRLRLLGADLELAVRLGELIVARLQLRVRLLQLGRLVLQRVRLGLELVRLRLHLVARLGHRAQEERIFYRLRGAAPEILRQLQVLLPVSAPRLGRYEGDGAEHRVAPAERHHHEGDEPQLAEHPQVLLVLRRLLQQLGRNLGHELRLPAPDHRGRADLEVRVRGIALLQRLREPHPLGVPVRHHHPLRISRDRRRKVHGAPVCDLLHGEIGHVAQGGLVVEGGGEDAAGLGQEACTTLRLLGCGAGGLLADPPVPLLSGLCRPGHVLRGANHAHRLAPRPAHHLPAGLDQAYLAVGPDYAVLVVEPLAGLHRPVQRLLDPLAVPRVDHLHVQVEADLLRRWEPEDPVQLRRPEDAVAHHVPLPAAGVGDPLHLGQAALRLPDPLGVTLVARPPGRRRTAHRLTPPPARGPPRPGSGGWPPGAPLRPAGGSARPAAPPRARGSS
jgi:hypothetical protein